MESVTIRPQYSSVALTLKNPKPKSPNPDHKIITKISSDEFVWDESSCFFYMLRLYFRFIPELDPKVGDVTGPWVAANNN